MLQIKQVRSNQATQEEILDFRSVANRTFGCDHVTEDYFKAKYLDNIYGPSVLFLAYWDGQPVGARACWRNDLDGKEAYQSADSSVLPAFQGKGVFRAILEKTAEFAAKNPNVILYGFPNQNSSPVYQNPNSLQRTESLYPKKFYFNTMYRFKMLDYLSKSDELEKKYRAWVIGYGYLQMHERRDIEKGTIYEEDFRRMSKDVLRKTKLEFLFMKHFPLKKKARFIIAWYYPKVYSDYIKIVG